MRLEPLDVHRCHAKGCRIPTPPEYLFCEPHWRKVPRALRDRVWGTYREGQCDDRNPSREWLDAADAAIAFIAKLERGNYTLREYLLDAGARCTECPLSVDGMPAKAVASTIPQREIKVALVGEAPGRREVVTGQVFVGPSGELLDQALTQNQIDRGELAILNCTSCGPIPSHLDEVKKLAARACRPRLLYELKAIQPKVILTLGGTALEMLSSGGHKVTAARGSLVDVAEDVSWNGAKPWLLPTFHPAAILRGGDGEQQKSGAESKSVDVQYYFLLYDLSKAVRFARGEISVWRTKGSAFARDTDGAARSVILSAQPPVLGLPARQQQIRDALGAFARKAEAVGEFALDVETTGKDSLECDLTSIAVATADDGFVATWDIWSRDPVLIELLRGLVANPQLRKILQNGIFDCTVLARFGLPISAPVDDTLIMHHTSFPGLTHQLQQVVSQFFLSPPWKAEFRKSTQDVADLTTYNLGDAQGTYQLAAPLRKAIRTVQTDKAYEADRQLVRVAEHMRRVGFWIDRKEQQRQAAVQHSRIAYMKEHLKGELAAIEEPWREALARVGAAVKRKKDPDSYEERIAIRLAEIQKLRGKATLTDSRMIGLFKPKGKRDLVALFDVLHIPVSGFTPSGLPKTGKDDMERAAALHPLMRKLLHLREATNIDALFISGLPIKADGRVHPDWKVQGTIAGRWSAGKAQNWKKDMPGWPPEKGADGKWKLTPSGDWVCPKENPRAQVCAPPGRMLVGADYDALHWRIFALLTGDAFLNECFRLGRDMHPIVARECFPEFVKIDDELKSLGVARPKDGLPDHLKNDKELVRRWKLWKMIRDIAKKIGYGRAYGGGAETIYEQAVKDFPSLTFMDVDHALPIIDKMISGVTEWRSLQEEEARRNRQSREPLFGRVRLYPLGNFDPNVVYNFPILAFESALQARAILRFTAVLHPERVDLKRLRAADVLWESDEKWINTQWVKLSVRGVPTGQVELLVNGHDSMLAEAPESASATIANVMQGAMTQRISIAGRTMDFPAEAATGERWSQV